MNGFVVFLIILLLLVVFGYGGWYFYARWNASRNGLPPPSPNPIAAFRNRSAGGGATNYPGPAPGGIKGFIDTQLRKFKGKNNRSAPGAYEEPLYESGGQTRGRGAGSRLDPDEAWSSRVGDEAYYEEQELGLHDHDHNNHQSSNPYGSSSYVGAAELPPSEAPRGRSRQRDSYEEHYDGGSARQNPFGDDHAASLRGVSPRPVGQPDDTSYHGGATVQMPSISKKAPSLHSLDSLGDSRRSAFREEM